MLNDPNPKDALAHTRFQHCTLAAAMIETVMTRGSFGDEEIGEATLATFMHDYAIPGLGDTMKTLDRKGLDEETHFLDSLSPERQELLLKRLKIDIRRVDGIINGAINTPATSLLHSNGIDIDKISYVAIDCFNFLQMCQDNKELPEWNGPWRDREDGLAVLPGNIGVRSRDDQFGLWQQYNHWRPPALKHHLESILQKDPDLFEIHKDIEVHRENGSGEFKAVFSNPRRALAFIRMRAYLCSMLYCSDESRGKEAGYFHHLFGRLYGRGLLKAEHLRRMTDREAAFTLLATLAELEGVPVGYGIKKNGDIRPYVSYSDDTYVVHYGHDRGLMDYFIPLIIGSRPYIIKRFDNHQELYKETPPLC